VRLEIPKKNLIDWLWQHGEMPLPPYIKSRDPMRDKNRYQAVWADPEQNGSAAAPTASLHFDLELERTLQNRGVIFLNTYLHVGLGTFEPVRVEKLSAHELHSEKMFIQRESAKALKNPEQSFLAVGTTALRTLESAAHFLDAERSKNLSELDLKCDQYENIVGSTRLFVRPGYEFKRTKHLWTNFHLPESTLFVLVSCFAGSRKLALEAYQHAIEHKYRFFSYGDASLWI
jgi:S-adenosylmethionine:tRNA ribosyltransferase-isomerase